jgi:hypothetical protein
MHAFAYQNVADGSEITVGSGIAIASTVLPQTVPVSSTILEELWSKGLMMPSVTTSKYVLFGMLSRGEQIKGKTFPTCRSILSDQLSSWRC